MIFFRKIKRQKQCKPPVKICPKCGSIDVSIDKRAVVAWGVPPMYFCKRCGFVSYIFPEISKKEKEQKTEKKEKK